MALNTYLHKLETYLRSNYPDCVLMHTKGNIEASCDYAKSKHPAECHKSKTTEQLWQAWTSRGKSNCSKGLLILLRKGLIVIDIDDMDVCNDLEAQYPEMRETATQKTRTGKHYFFERTPACDEFKIYDVARGMKDAPGKQGKVLPIDIKTVCSTGTGGVISIYPSPGKEWERPIYECPPIDLPISLLTYIVEKLANNKIETSAKKTGNNKVLPPLPSRTEDHDEVKALVDMLDPTQFDDYPNWMRLGWCLHNIDESLLGLWIEFSKKSQKFVEGECEEKWRDMRDKGLGIGSLHTWAKRDSPYEYRQLMNKRVHQSIIDCNGSHNEVAAIAHKLLKGKYVWVCNKIWYEFNGNLWKEDKETIHLRHELSTTVRLQFMHTLHRVHERAAEARLERYSDRSSSSRKTESQVTCEKLLGIAYKLQDEGFKDQVVRAMREYFADTGFFKKLDSKQHLLAFNNGVWDFTTNEFRPAQPDDYVSLSTGYDYQEGVDDTYAEMVKTYFEKLHPVQEQREYVLKTIARQLYGDNGNELFHIHAGFQGAAGNGKTKFFEVLELCLGDYVRKFPIQILTAKNREEAGKPQPEYQYWRGRRILYCTEPKDDDLLHSGIMKDLTGGEQILYRLLYSNDVEVFRPQYKMHIMCNMPPKIDGSDEGVRRRIRKIDYISRFVDAELVDEANHYYARDVRFFELLKNDVCMKMEVLWYILDHYDHGYEYSMPQVIADNSTAYLDENNAVKKFVQEFIKKDKEGCFAFADAKDLFRVSEHFNGKLGNIKLDLEKALGRKFLDQKKIDGRNTRNVMVGYILVRGENADGDL